MPRHDIKFPSQLTLVNKREIDGRFKQGLSSTGLINVLDDSVLNIWHDTVSCIVIVVGKDLVY